MQTLSPATTAYLAPPDSERFYRDRLHLAATKSADKALTHFIAEFYNPEPSAPGQKRYPCSETRTWAAKFPESKHIVKNHSTLSYELPITDMVVERINACIPRSNITFADIETQLMYERVLLRGIEADKAAEIYADFKHNNKVPDHKFVFSSEFPLAGFQQVGLVNSLQTDAYALFMEQGTGKTPIGVAMVCNEAEKHFAKLNRMYRSIIVCPKNVRTNWENEFQKFATTSGKVTILQGTWFNRVHQLIKAFIQEDDCKYTVVVCSYETLSQSWKAIEAVVKMMPGAKWDLALLDESHYIKNGLTKRFKYAKLLRDMSIRKSILTGTPITNTALDLYTQLEFLGQGYSGFYDYKYFRAFFARHRMDQATGREVYDGLQNVPFMQERLARYTYIVRQTEVQKDLPDRVYDTIEVEMTDYQKSVYERIRDEMLIEIESQLSSSENKMMTINNVLTRLLKLAQVTSGFISYSQVLDEMTGELLTPASIDRLDPDPKLEELVELLKAKKPEEKTIVWSCWVPNIKTIAARLKIEGIDCVTFYGDTNDNDRADAVYRFNCVPECKVFIGNPGAGGTGLNLIGYPPEGHEIYRQTGKTPDDWETNCNHVIYYSQDWSMVKRSQSEKRAHRRGTRGPVRITDLVVPHTVDTEIRAAVLDKTTRALEISDLRKILERLISMELMCD
jgi:SNF2 family DNA or RNA helicase